MMVGKESINVVVCGPKGSGKSSIIAAFVTDHFPESVQSTMPEVNIPPEENEDGTQMAIIDTPSGEGCEGRVRMALNRADAILLVYDAGRPETFYSLEEYWLPMISGAAENIPVIIVCNKTDVFSSDGREVGGCPSDTNRSMAEQMSDKVAGLLKKFKFVQLGLFCSAKCKVGLEDVFQVVNMSALYPTPALFDVQTGKLQPAFCKVLTRVFRIHDRDYDGLWSDAELKDFQLECFGSGLSEDEVNIIKKVLSKRNPDCNDLFEGVHNYLTLHGLMQLIIMFIDKNQLVIPWTIPAHYGYDDALKLIVEPGQQTLLKDIRPFDGGGFNVQQLTDDAITFLCKTFDQFSHDGILTLHDEESIFSILEDPAAAPWHVSHLCDFAECDIEPDSFSDPVYLKIQNQAIKGRSRDEWIALWQMVASLKPSVACEFLYHLGFLYTDEEGGVLATRKQDKLRLESSSLVVHAFLFGSEGCKESAQHLVCGRRRRLEGSSSCSHRSSGGSTADKSDDDEFAAVTTNVHLNPNKPRSLAVPISMAGIVTTSLILTVIPSGGDILWEQDNIIAIERCDVAIIAFDPLGAASVDYALQVTQHLPGKLPRLMVGIRQDHPKKDVPPQNSLAKVEVYCKDNGLTSQPIVLSATGLEPQQTEGVLKAENGMETLEERIVRTAADPSRCRKAIPKKCRSLDMARIKEIVGSQMINVKLGIRVGGVVVLGVAAACCILWWWDNSSRPRDKVAQMKGINSIRSVPLFNRASTT